MRRALIFCVIFVAGCAVQKAERAPSTSPAAPPPSGAATGVDQDGTGAAPTSVTPSTAPVPMPGTAGGSTMVVNPEVGKAQASFDDASKAFSAAGADCAQLCKALHSMTHATERLCDLTQSGPATEQQRCTDAKARLDSASAKVKSSCGTC